MSSSFLEKDIEERHEYARHTLTSLVTWFTFFVVLNYGAMSWLATSKGITPHAVILIACGFILQNVLGVVVCFVVRAYFFRSNERLLDSQAKLQRRHAGSEDSEDLAGKSCLPLRLYSAVIILMVTALVPILVAWPVLIYLVVYKIVPSSK